MGRACRACRGGSEGLHGAVGLHVGLNVGLNVGWATRRAVLWQLSYEQTVCEGGRYVPVPKCWAKGSGFDVIDPLDSIDLDPFDFRDVDSLQTFHSLDNPNGHTIQEPFEVDHVKDSRQRG